MFSLNQVTLIGRIGKDPDVRYVNDDTAVMSFSVATEIYNSKTKESKTEWTNVTLWRPNDYVINNLKKGMLIAVVGRLQTRKYEDKNGVTRYMTEVIANQIVFCGKSNSEPQTQKTVADETAKDIANKPANTEEPESEDLPF